MSLSVHFAPVAAACLLGLSLAASCGSNDPGADGSASEVTSTTGAGAETEVTSTTGAGVSTEATPTEGAGTTGSSESGTGTGDTSTGGDAVCGDGLVQPGEACDDGNADDSDGCTNACAEAACGDGIVGPGELCDDGNADDSDGCTSACASTSCGDGIVQGIEECDDGNADDSDACLNTCKAASCGDGVVQAEVEACDDGNANDADACLNTCKAASCGDGAVQAGVEACDDGNANDADACTSACTAAVCGDGVVQAGVEACDDGNTDDTDACTNACKAAVCGDGIVGPGELCDDGNMNDADGCTNTCTSATCGDGVVQVGVEECDDGNQVDTDACLDTCLLASCGDGAVQARIEACDDGNQIDTDACTAACEEAACGDGIVQAGVEACDDGNVVDTDACTAACTVAECGDGVIQTGVEECDEGAANSDSAPCTSACKAAVCGDGLLLAGAESCDDGNGANGDGCEADCSPTLRAVEAGGEHTCALSASGRVRCWGWGDGGRLGYGNLTSIGDDEGPSAAGDVQVGATTLQVSAGDQHACAVLTGGGVRCWGAGGSGRLGYGNTNSIGDNETPASVGVINVGANVVKVTAGDLHTCVQVTGGKVRCWGAGSAGRLGYGNLNNIGDTEAPATAGDVKVGAEVLDVSAGDDHTCALVAGGKVRCWGRGSDGQLGYGNVNSIGDNEVPSTAGDVNVGGAVKQVAAGQTHTCALLENGSVRCWGASASGELGYGNTKTIGDNETPASAGNVDVGGVVVQVTAGWHHTCALLMNGGVRCWGSGAEGRLGYGNTNNIGDNETPASAGDVNLGGVAVAVTAGRHHTCAILAGGGLRCWGSGTHGKLGHANVTTIGDDEAPVTAGPVSVY
ncbi:RCC1 domain-containing protein [Nannocystis radixulma]|uniref:DUF4215 domain-containing protein n=1 Tax=Nannocystis radixulma TaxID=2995305 RepID=A0ABT5B024_9BACT|nr:DUF4215 domain-containing protein [Nannocystis radixulma]MDC0667098.1 DUF4215 domain-containing protein [Nannocystis radixulma]